MARARMINRDLAASERFWDCSPDARTTYMIALPFTDRDGFLPAPPRKMLGLFLGMSGWSLGHVEEIRDELIAAGLWENGPLDSVRVVRFHEFQPGCTPGTKRYGQEAASKYVSGDPRSTPTVPPRIAPQVKLNQDKVRQTTPAGVGCGGVQNLATTEGRAQRLVEAWRGAHRRLAAKNPDDQFLPTGVDFYEASKAAKALGETVDLFGDGEGDGSLAHELARIMAVYHNRGIPYRFPNVAKMVGHVFRDAGDLGDPVVFRKEASGGEG